MNSRSFSALKITAGDSIGNANQTSYQFNINVPYLDRLGRNKRENTESVVRAKDGSGS